MTTPFVACRTHGQQQTTFVCKHLASAAHSGVPSGFFFGPDPDNPRPDAWCTACNDLLESNGGQWTVELEKSVGITLLCGACYDKARDLNLGTT